jgi:hypothetical protein
MEIKYYTAPCGAGKSFQAATRMINTPGRYIVVRDRVEAISEYQTQLYAMAVAANVDIRIHSIVAEKGQSVRLNVEEIPEKYNVHHAIVLITHKALTMCDFSGFSGWSIIIDETPVVIDRQDLQTSQSRAFFEANYELTNLTNDKDKPTGWSGVTLSKEGWELAPADFENDDCFRMLRIFHERVTAASVAPEDASQRIARRATDNVQRAVIGSLDDWQDMDDGRRWTWWSLWSPKQLSAFDSVEFMANSFDKSMTFEVLRNFNRDIDWIEVPLSAGRKFEDRKVVIRFYTRGHVASMTLFDTDAGKGYLNAIAKHQARDRQIWMANDRHAGELDGMGGLRLKPHQAGSNAYANQHAATAIYAVKPSAETRALMHLLGVHPDVWTRSYEHEAILQFVNRTSIRDPKSTETVTLTVYDKEQADYLASYLRDQPHCDVEVAMIDLGFANVERTKSGVKARVLTVDEAEAKKAARKEQKTKAQRARRAKLKAAK